MVEGWPLRPCGRLQFSGGTSHGYLDLVASTIRERRIALGLSREALAKHADVSVRSIKRVEDGEEVRDTTLASIERAIRDMEAGTGQAPSTTPGLTMPADVVADALGLDDDGRKRLTAFLSRGPLLIVSEQTPED